MKKIEKETVTIEQEIIKDIICNKCGKSCLRGPKDPYGLIEVNVSGGFCSKPLSDGCTYTFSICEECLNEMFNNFKVPVQVTHWI